MRKISLLTIAIILLFIFLFPKETLAIRFDLTAPTEILQRGQQVAFTVNIDTKGETLTSTQIGATYKTEFLQYINTTPGNTFSTISVTPMDGGKLLITGTQPSGFSGQGIFAYLNFKIIAEAPGSTELCALWAPSTTPIPTPTTPAATTPIPTTQPRPTALPKSGNNEPMDKALTLGALFIAFTGSALVYKKLKTPSVDLPKRNKK